MEYERHFEVVDGAETNVVYHAGPNKCIPSSPLIKWLFPALTPR